ncbi:MAG: HD domain-containing protein [Pseudomonadota bacterium]
MSDIEAKLSFLLEMEKLKAVLRRTRPVGQERLENSAEHSWQTAMAALLFMPPQLDALRVLKMLMIHDIVEIDTGDTFVYDEAARSAVADDEARAAARIFGSLPEPLGVELLELWHEFENRASPEAVFAKAMDRVCPVLQNLASEPNSWQENDISGDRVLAKNAEIENADRDLWSSLEARIRASFGMI